MANVKGNNTALLQNMNSGGVQTVKQLLSLDAYKSRFSEILGRRSAQFMSSIVSVVNSSTDLQKCVPNTVIQSALKAAVLDLPIEQNFGFAYLVPFYSGKKKYHECQFQVGWKGFVQLALRTGQYKNINVVDIRKGELKSWNPLTEELEIEFIEDEEKRENTEIVGYAGYFSLTNGYEKKTYWSMTRLLSHARKYSQTFKKYGNGTWTDQRDAMCRKTVVKDMLRKWGVLSVEFIDAVSSDQAVITGENDLEYPDTDVIDVEPEEGEPEKAEEVQHERI